jgi:hypothetical protein
MRTLDLDWADLELAFRDATGTESHLDSDTGEVLTLVRGFDDERDIRDKLKRFPKRFLRITPVDKSFTRNVLDVYVRRQSGELRHKLDQAVAGPGGIARAMVLLQSDKPALAAFSRIEQSELVRVVEEFLAAHGLRSGVAPPAPDLFEGLAS